VSAAGRYKKTKKAANAVNIRILAVENLCQTGTQVEINFRTTGTQVEKTAKYSTKKITINGITARKT
jgi:hypothetical protein